VTCLIHICDIAFLCSVCCSVLQCVAVFERFCAWRLVIRDIPLSLSLTHTHTHIHIWHASLICDMAFLCYSVLQCVQCFNTVCCSVLQCVAVCCSVSIETARVVSLICAMAFLCCSVLQCVAECCSVLYSVLQCVNRDGSCHDAESCSALQCVAVL